MKANKCNSSLGIPKGLLYLKNYNHIMSKKIRTHLYKRQFEKIGVINPSQAAVEIVKWS